MLLLKRKIGDRILIGSDIVLTVISEGNCQVRLGVQATARIAIRRPEDKRASILNRKSVNSEESIGAET
ncbi:carbon storage regulator [Telmatocola sphagniphila]|uniref:Carbon storage regulator n=1 Tax=Telmatocola sphagniphila TaxID=1123043 RepID=A0A8E6B7B5_9BACT|nr:carbon storage regulator [Telmatocola sphagniphila]